MKKIFLTGIALLLLFSYSYSKDWDDTPFPGNVTTKNGEMGYNEIIDLPALSETAVVNAHGISTSTLVTSGTTYVAAVASQSSGEKVSGGVSLTQPTYPRNITGEVNFIQGTATTTVSGTMTVYGFDNHGNYVSEAITISTSSTDGTGSKAFVYVDTITISGLTMSGMCGTDEMGNLISSCTVRIGVSNKIGIWGDLRHNADILKVTAAYVDISSATYRTPASFINTTYDTINLGAIGVIPDGDIDYRIWYRKNVKD